MVVLIVANIKGTLLNNGSVLMPVDSAGRVVELMMFIEDNWENESYPVFLYYSICILIFSASPCATSIVDTLKRHLEWCSKAINDKFIINKSNTFDLK